MKTPPSPGLENGLPGNTSGVPGDNPRSHNQDPAQPATGKGPALNDLTDDTLLAEAKRQAADPHLLSHEQMPFEQTGPGGPGGQD